MANLTERQRAENRFTKTGLETINALVSDIAELLQVNNAHIAASTCTGAWKGSFDYSLTYDEGAIFIKNIGNHRTNSSITGSIIFGLEELRSQYAKVFLSPSRIMHALIKREKVDNARGVPKGFMPYTVKRIGIVTKGRNYAGWAYLILDIAGHEQFFIETNLKYEILGVELDKLADAREIRDRHAENACYIYNGYGHALSGWSVPEGVTLISRESY